jgi:hypothetical protein
MDKNKVSSSTAGINRGLARGRMSSGVSVVRNVLGRAGAISRAALYLLMLSPAEAMSLNMQCMRSTANDEIFGFSGQTNGEALTAPFMAELGRNCSLILTFCTQAVSTLPRTQLMNCDDGSHSSFVNILGGGSDLSCIGSRFIGFHRRRCFTQKEMRYVFIIACGLVGLMIFVCVASMYRMVREISKPRDSEGAGRQALPPMSDLAVLDARAVPLPPLAAEPGFTS